MSKNQSLNQIYENCYTKRGHRQHIHYMKINNTSSNVTSGLGPQEVSCVGQVLQLRQRTLYSAQSSYLALLLLIVLSYLRNCDEFFEHFTSTYLTNKETAL